MTEGSGGEGASRVEELERKVKTMGACIEVAALITSTLDFDELISLVMRKNRDVMGAEACSILLYNARSERLDTLISLQGEPEKTRTDRVEIEMGQGIAGRVARDLEPALVVDAESDPRFDRAVDDLAGRAARSLMAVPMVGRSGLVGVAEAVNPGHKERFDRFDLEAFHTHSKQVAIAIENARYHEESLKRERLRNELEIAASIQRSFLPDPPVIRRGHIRVSGVNVSAANVGGDFYDFIEHPGGGAVGVVVGDVSGKGVSGAIYMSKIMSDFRYIALTSGTTSEAFERLNSQIAKAPRGMFLTAVYIIAEPLTGQLRLSVAGHPPALWLTRGGLRILEAPAGPPLGIKPAEYPESNLAMEEGDRLVVVTDGVFEAKDSRGNIMGFEGLAGFLRERRGEPEILKVLMEHLKDFSSGARMHDDMTAVEVAYGVNG